MALPALKFLYAYYYLFQERSKRVIRIFAAYDIIYCNIITIPNLANIFHVAVEV